MSSTNTSNYDQQQEQHSQQQQDKESSTNHIRKPDSPISIIRQSRAVALSINRQKRPHLTPLLIPDAEDCKGSNSSRWASQRRFHFRGLEGSPLIVDHRAARPGSPTPSFQSPPSFSDRSYRFRKIASWEEKLFSLQQECDNFHHYVTSRIDDLASEMEYNVNPVVSKHKSSSVVLKEKFAQIVHQMKGLTYSPHRKPEEVTVELEDVFPPISSQYHQSSCPFNSPIDQGDDKENMDRQIQIGVQALKPKHHANHVLTSPIHLINASSRLVDLFSPSPHLAVIRSKAMRGRKFSGSVAAAGPGFNIVTGQGEWRSVQTPYNSPLIETVRSPIISIPITTTTAKEDEQQITATGYGGATSPTLGYE
eukprot:gene26777-35464_t